MSDEPAASGEATATELLDRAAGAGIHRLEVPTPFQVGPVNCWLIDDDPLTLVDTGPNAGTSLDRLARALDEHGRRIEDLELIVLTHEHADHVGLLEILVQRSGAEVAALTSLGPWLERFPDSARDEDRWATGLMRRHGVPEDLVTALALVADAFRPYGSGGRVTRPLCDGEALALRERTLEILHRPGHSPTDTLLWDAERGILIGGDHLLAHISSNAIITRSRHGAPDGPRPTPLLDYIASLRRTAELPADLVLGGHGPPVADHRGLIASRLRMHDHRAQKILGMLGAGPLSAYDVALRMWGNVAVTQAFLTLSEVLGHADLLLRDGLARECDDGDVVRREAL